MRTHLTEVLSGHDGAWLPPPGRVTDDLPLRYALLEQFSKGWETPEEGLRNYQALARLNVLPEDAVFYLIASVLVDEIAEPRIFSLFDAIESESSLGGLSAYEDPIVFDESWAFLAERLTADTMCEHDEFGMAEMFLNDRLQFEIRIESGRRYFHGEAS
jgi:hypothetical protein